MCHVIPTTGELLLAAARRRPARGRARARARPPPLRELQGAHDGRVARRARAAASLALHRRLRARLRRVGRRGARGDDASTAAAAAAPPRPRPRAAAARRSGCRRVGRHERRRRRRHRADGGALGADGLGRLAMKRAGKSRNHCGALRNEQRHDAVTHGRHEPPTSRYHSSSGLAPSSGRLVLRVALTNPSAALVSSGVSAVDIRGARICPGRYRATGARGKACWHPCCGHADSHATGMATGVRMVRCGHRHRHRHRCLTALDCGLRKNGRLRVSGLRGKYVSGLVSWLVCCGCRMSSMSRALVYQPRKPKKKRPTLFLFLLKLVWGRAEISRYHHVLLTAPPGRARLS